MYARAILALLAAAAATPMPAAAQQTQRVVRQLAFGGNRALDDQTLKAFIATSASGWAARYWWIRWVGLGEKRYLDEVELRRDVVRLILVYRQAGYMDVTVDTLVRRDPESAFVKFVIYEGEPVRVERLEVVGADTLFDVPHLLRELPLQVGDPFNRALLQASADTIAVRLRRRGYPYVEVLRSFDADATNRRATVALEVVPGPRMWVGEIVIEGLEDLPADKVRRLLPLRRGQPYSEDRVLRAQREFYDLGVFSYVDVALLDTVPPTDPGDSLVALRVRVQEGRRHRVRAGLGYGTEECIRAQAGWTMGGFLGVGRSLDVTGRAGMIGVGRPTRGLGFWKHNSICGGMADEFTADTLTYALGASVRQSGFPGARHVTSLGAFMERRAEPRAYVREAQGGNLVVTFNALSRDPFAISYSNSVGSTTAPPGVYCSVFQVCTEEDREFLERSRPFAGLGITAVRRRTDAFLDPTQGSLGTLTLLASNRLLGSDPLLTFNRGEAMLARYHRIGRRQVFAWRIWGGGILPRLVGTSSDTARYVPPEHRFYAGGPNSVRGFPTNGLGPLVYVTRDTIRFDTLAAARGDTIYDDLRRSPTGGSSALVLNAELRVPAPVFSTRVQVTFFVDVGQVWDHPKGFYFSVSDLRMTPGVGLRFTTPLGPVRVEAGYNGYRPEAGALYFETDSSIVRIRPAPSTPGAPLYSVPRGRAFLDRWTLQFAVGPTF